MVNFMKKFFTLAFGFALLPFLFSCKPDNEKVKDEKNEFKLLAIVKSTGETLEVEVIESDYAFGEYWVITHEETKYTDKDGNSISREDLKPDAKIEITYGGPVMMSYPPQIVASEIKIIE